MAFLVAWGDFIIGAACIIGGIVIENKFGVYPKVKSAFDWIKSKF